MEPPRVLCGEIRGGRRRGGGAGADLRLIGIAGWTGAGKTTLLARLIPALIADGCTVSTLKHAHHDFDIDRPGKDSFVHRAAGAAEVLISSSRRWALMHEVRDGAPPNFAQLLAHLGPVDLVLAEGFKSEAHPKIEVFRPSVGKPLLQTDDPSIVAVVSDAALSLPVPVLDFDDLAAIVALVRARAAPVGD